MKCVDATMYDNFVGIYSGSTSLFNSSAFSDDDENSHKKLKRGVLPKRATQIMKSWLFQHIAVSSLFRIFC